MLLCAVADPAGSGTARCARSLARALTGAAVMEHTRLACKSSKPEALEPPQIANFVSANELPCSHRAQIVEARRGTRMLLCVHAEMKK
jgi:hypothetical protein